jgi:dynein heavy chain
LLSVAAKFLADIDVPEDIRDGIVKFMPFSFGVVNDASERFKEVERRFCYTTPKSFLELIKLFTTMYENKKQKIEDSKERLSNGLIKLITTQEQVSGLEIELQEFSIVVEEKKASADVFAEEVGIEKGKVEAENEKANIEADNCAAIQTRVEIQKASCEEDLEKALPLVEQAQAALDTLSKKDFQEAKALQRPPQGVDDITCAVMHIVSGIDPLVKVDKAGKLMDKTWQGAQKMMSNPQ